ARRVGRLRSRNLDTRRGAAGRRQALSDRRECRRQGRQPHLGVGRRDGSSRSKVKSALFLCVLSVLGGGSALRAQSTPEVAFGVEVRRDRFQYHFENLSSIDTPFTVPHVFEQRYIADNVWAVASLRYVA